MPLLQGRGSGAFCAILPSQTHRFPKLKCTFQVQTMSVSGTVTVLHDLPPRPRAQASSNQGFRAIVPLAESFHLHFLACNHAPAFNLVQLLTPRPGRQAQSPHQIWAPSQDKPPFDDATLRLRFPRRASFRCGSGQIIPPSLTPCS
jgi:hypothetical protein